MERKKVVINWSKQKKEMTYLNLKKEFPEIFEKCQDAAEFKFNLSFCQLKQDIVDLAFKELFKMPAITKKKEHKEGGEEIKESNEDNKKGENKENNEEGQKIVEVQEVEKFQFEKLKIIDISVQSSSLTNINFLSYFLDYPNIQEITLDCSETSMAWFLLRESKSHQNLKSIRCIDFFIKKQDSYSILSNDFFTETLQYWSGIEDQIIVLKLQFKDEIFDNILEILNMCTQLREIDCQLITLKDIRKQTNLFIQSLQSNCKSLQKLTIEVFFDELIPVIVANSFQKKVEIQILYVYQLLKILTPIKLLNYINSFFNSNQILLIPNCVEMNGKVLKLNMYSKVLIENIDPKKDELNGLLKLLANNIFSIDKLSLTFSPSQNLNLKSFVEFLKILCSQTNLQRIELLGINFSKSMCALSLCKLVKAGKEYAKINSSSFTNGSLELRVHQISDSGMNSFLQNNCFVQGASRITQITVISDVIIGNLKPLSSYLKASPELLNSFLLEIINKKCDLTHMFLPILNDKSEMKNFTNSFSFIQKGQYETILSFDFSQNFTSIKMLEKYSLSHTFELMGDEELSKDFQNQLLSFLKPLTHFTSNNENYSIEELISKFEILVFLRELCMIYLLDKFLPFQISTFFQVIAPVLPLNPYMIVADLYYY